MLHSGLAISCELRTIPGLHLHAQFPMTYGIATLVASEEKEALTFRELVIMQEIFLCIKFLRSAWNYRLRGSACSIASLDQCKCDDTLRSDVPWDPLIMSTWLGPSKSQYSIERRGSSWTCQVHLTLGFFGLSRANSQTRVYLKGTHPAIIPRTPICPL